MIKRILNVLDMIFLGNFRYYFENHSFILPVMLSVYLTEEEILAFLENMRNEVN